MDSLTSESNAPGIGSLTEHSGPDTSIQCDSVNASRANHYTRVLAFMIIVKSQQAASPFQPVIIFL